MNSYFTIVLLAFCIFLMNKNDVSCKSRGGGGRGGGSRSGSSRSGYRSGSSGYRSSSASKSRNIMSSSRYNTWSVRVGVRSSTRYRTSSWSTQQHAIISGHILMSSHQRSRYHMSDRSYYDGISVCYNEDALYSRNVTASPWFICPWDDLSERYCCGDEVEERCCRYFERTGHKAGLIIGIIMIILLFFAIFFWCRSCQKADKTGTVIYSPQFKADEAIGDGSVLLIYPPMPVDNSIPYSTDPAPTYNAEYPAQMNYSAPYPVDPTANQPYPNAMNNSAPYPTAMTNSAPYPTNSTGMDNTLPYPVNPPTAAMSSGNITERSNPSAPPNAFEQQQQPPSYDDVLRNKM